MKTTEAQWLTVHEALDVLKIGRTSLWKLTKNGQLVAHRRGPDRRAKYYLRSEVERLAHEYRPVMTAHAQDQEA
jgi:hypothetical protein